jgi:hypothetical protein
MSVLWAAWKRRCVNVIGVDPGRTHVLYATRVYLDVSKCPSWKKKKVRQMGRTEFTLSNREWQYTNNMKRTARMKRRLELLKLPVSELAKYTLRIVDPEKYLLHVRDRFKTAS